MNGNKSHTLRYKNLIGQMTLEEKASLMSGQNFWHTKAIDRLNIPSMMLTDGPHGLRKQGGKSDHLGLNKSIPATCFPTAATLANSWDTSLMKAVGSWLGKEALGENVSVLLGPGLNIKRNPLCGRNFEYFSEDPYLTGKLSAAMIQGIQNEGISACPKHFAVNSQETRRMIVDEIVDERALHEIYLEGFRYAINEGKANVIMSSYNKVNGVYTNENNFLMDILRKDWLFKGLVVTDWGGNHDRVAGLIAGNGLEMPSTNGMTDTDIINAIKSGDLSESVLDENVDQLLSVVFNAESKLNQGKQYEQAHHHNKAIEAAKRSVVLLKNNHQILPLKDQKIAIIGDFAKKARYQGAGSSLIEPTQVDNILDALHKTSLNIIGYEPGFKRLGGKSQRLKARALQLAKQSEVVLLCVGLDEGSEAEGVDRKHMRLSQNQLELIDALATLDKEIVIVLAGGSPIEMPFVDKVSGILHGYLPGQGGGSALAEVLTGMYSPSGKLAESYPLVYSDVPSAKYYPGEILTSEHRESIYIGYRYYDKANKTVRFPFGFGLSYTSFEYSNLSVNEKSISVSIKNTGDVSGEEIVQVYIRPLVSQDFRPEKELKAFEKVYLQPGEEKKVEMTLDEHAFSYYHIGLKKWVQESGAYNILVGASSRDIRLTEAVMIKGQTVSMPYDLEAIAPYRTGTVANLNSSDFEKLLEHKLPSNQWDETKKIDRNDIVEQAQYGSWFGRLLYKLIMFIRNFLMFIGKPIPSNNVMFVLEMPFRSLARMSGGKMNMQMLDGLLMMVNGSFFKGLYTFIKYKIRN